MGVSILFYVQEWRRAHQGKLLDLKICGVHGVLARPSCNWKMGRPLQATAELIRQNLALDKVQTESEPFRIHFWFIVNRTGGSCCRRKIGKRWTISWKMPDWRPMLTCFTLLHCYSAANAFVQRRKKWHRTENDQMAWVGPLGLCLLLHTSFGTHSFRVL